MQATYYSEAGSETEIHQLIQVVMGRSFEALDTMAESGSFDATSYCSQMAPLGFPSVLAMEVEPRAGSPSHIRGNADSYPQTEHRESVVGSRENPRHADTSGFRHAL